MPTPPDPSEAATPAHKPGRRLTHLDGAGQAVMVDVGDKAVTTRIAIAEATILMAPATARAIADATLKKGDVLTIARIAGIQAAKQTSTLIPLCHPLALDHIDIRLEVGPDRVCIEARTRTSGKTGVEMEALTAASVAALTIYDMAKAIDRGMTITNLGVREKSGGASGSWTRDTPG